MSRVIIEVIASRLLTYLLNKSQPTINRIRIRTKLNISVVLPKNSGESVIGFMSYDRINTQRSDTIDVFLYSRYSI